MSDLRQLVIVGASLAGLRAAEALRQQGYEGRLSLVGAEPHLPYDRPPLSKEILQGTWAPEKASLVRGSSLDDLDLDLRLGRRAVALDVRAKQIELDDGAHLSWDGVVIATGTTPRRLTGMRDLDGLYTLRTLDECLAIRADLGRSPRVVVVGAGFIGAEVAASCRSRGLEVTMIEALPVPLEQVVGPDVGRALAAYHCDQGVDLRCGASVEGFEGGARVERVRLADGTSVAADVVVVGIGVTPATDWLEGSGVEIDDGVLCDETCATSVPGVVAAGDVARWYNPSFDQRMRVEHWTNAGEQGRAAALRLLAGDANAEPFASIPFFWSDQYDLKIQSAGLLTGSDESKVVHGSLEEQRFLALYARKGRFVGALAFNEPRRLMGCRRKLRENLSWEEALESAAG